MNRPIATAARCFAGAALLALPGLGTAAARAQQPPVPLPGTELRTLHSRVLDRDMELYVQLPRNYPHGDRRYPVLFALDGNRAFPLFATTALILQTPGIDAPDVVIVGVGYHVDDDPMRALAQWARWRSRDFTPDRDPEMEAYWNDRLGGTPDADADAVRTGGADDFLAFLRTEAVPFIDAHYRVDPHDRALAGYSLGGLFTLYALFHAPGTFARFYAGDPSIRDRLFDDEDRYATSHDDLPARLVLTTTGSGEDVRRLLDRLRDRHYPGLSIHIEALDGVDHASGYPGSISRGLGLLYPPR